MALAGQQPRHPLTAPWFAEFDPDLVTFEMKEDGAVEPVTTMRLQDLNTFISNWQAANPLADFLLIGSSPVATSNSTQVADNQTLANVEGEHSWRWFGEARYLIGRQSQSLKRSDDLRHARWIYEKALADSADVTVTPACY